MNLITKQTIYTIDFIESELQCIVGVMNKYNCVNDYKLNNQELPIRDKLMDLLRDQFDEDD
jgi:hypothetical protein